MYSTCLFCQQPLGRNDVIEHFPVGRRLAYDAAKGRLWVVCRKCERWNLTPLDSRWEAIEEAERLYRGTRLRASTEHVGLARLREGLELVRIGEPLRPELAAWRYGDQFGRRWKRHLAMSSLGVAAVGAFVIAGPVTGMISLGAVSPILNSFNVINLARQKRRAAVTLPIAGHDVPLLVRQEDLRAARLTTDRSRGFTLRVQGVRRDRAEWWRIRPNERSGEHELIGEEAVRAAALLLPRLNHRGAGRRAVRDAVELLDIGRTPHETFALVAQADRARRQSQLLNNATPGTLAALPMAARLALEMASHEEAERRALEGKLAELERAWQQAEEIAAIADDLALPSGVRGAFARLKGGPSTER